MCETVNLIIDGRQIRAKKGQTILQAAKEYGIEIPNLCYHEAVKASGLCRLCIVELSANDYTRMVASCLHSVDDGLEVKTNTPRILTTRRKLVELLLTLYPNDVTVKKLASQLGIKHAFAVNNGQVECIEEHNCIACGLCVKVCEQIVGVSAIRLIGGGMYRKPAPKFHEPVVACIGCGSCYYVCPTHAIEMEDRGDTRFIRNWKAEYKLKKCKVCENYWAPEKQLEYIARKWNLPGEFFDVCPICR